MNAVERAMEVIKSGADALDAVVAGVNLVEEDSNDTSVGYGGLPMLTVLCSWMPPSSTARPDVPAR